MTANNLNLDAKPSAVNRRLLWLAIVVIGGVFFFIEHNFQVSRHEQFAPWSEAGGNLEAGHNVVKGLAFGLIGLLGAYLLFRRDGAPLNLTGWLPALMIGCLAWSIMSVLWSINPGMSCRRLTVLMICVLGAIGLARQFRPRDLALMATVINGSYLAVGVAAEVAIGTFRPWLADYRFGGTVHPNMQGINLAILCLASFCLSRSATRRRVGFWMVFVVGLAFLLLTRSRTSCIGLMLALAVLWGLNVSRRTQVLAALGAGFVICATTLIGTLFQLDWGDKPAEVVMLGRQEEIGALSGRIPLWTELLGYVRARPLQGYGYNSFWTEKHIDAVSGEVEWMLREAHNAYIDGLLSVGLIGTAMFLVVVFLALRRMAAAYRATGDLGIAFIACLFVFGMVNACMETGMADPNLTTLIAGSGVVGLFSLSSPQAAQLPSAVQGTAHGRRRECYES
jgi:exopolysaccharide production protein ExoQ